MNNLTQEEYTQIINFIFETGQLKRVKRSGWWVTGMKDPESVSEHSHRATIIAYLIGKLEGADAYKAALTCALHDLPEARINDLHKMGQRYIDYESAEKQVLEEQLKNLPLSIATEIEELIQSYNNDTNKEGIIARDADLLECIFQSKEYLELGYKDGQRWIDKMKNLLITDSAKKLYSLVEDSDIHAWHKNLSKVCR